MVGLDRRTDLDQFSELDVRLVVLDLLSPAAPITTRATTAALPSSDRPTPERVFDYLLAASIGSWAVLGLTATAAPLTATRLAVVLLHLTVASAILRRAPLVRLGSPRALLSSVPALVVAGVAFRSAAPLQSWPLAIEVVFVLGASLAICTFIAMGDSFAVLPARRKIVSSGPYRIVRHPAYAGELIMISACVASNPSPLAALVLVAAVPLVALRIRAEEDLLSSCEAYRAYRSEVRARLVPCLW